MSRLSLTVLLFLLSKCHGQTRFVYTSREEMLHCQSSTWQMNTEPYRTIDVNCTVKCVHVKPNTPTDTTIKEFCHSNHSNERCLTIAQGLFLKCVTDLDSGLFYPFKPSDNTIASYIIAIPKKDTIITEEISTVTITEGDFLTLNCTISPAYDKPFVVYWIKTIGENSICVYSYDFDMYSVKHKHNPYCNKQEELYNRFSNQTIEPNTHDIKIINVTEWDAGQYLCALHMSPYDDKKGNWKVIKNITVSMKKSITGELHSALYVTIPILLSLLVVVMAICLWKKSQKSSESQASQLQRDQNGEETTYYDCSPYAVGTGEEERELRSKWKSHHKEDHEVLETSTKLYSVVKMNDLYDSCA